MATCQICPSQPILKALQLTNFDVNTELAVNRDYDAAEIKGKVATDH